MLHPCRMYIDGEWVDGLSGKTFDDYDPFTREVFAQISLGEKQDARRAIDAAYNGWLPWMQTPPAERAMYLRKAADVLQENQDAD